MTTEDHPGIARYKKECEWFQFLYDAAQASDDPEMQLLRVRGAEDLGEILEDAVVNDVVLIV